MAVALLCSQADLQADLQGTVLWRTEFERHIARRLEDAQLLALTEKPDLVVVDRELPRAVDLVRSLREDPLTRQASIAIVSHGDFDPREVELLEAGANAVLRLPAGPEWDERLMRLVQVPTRAELRCAMEFDVEATVRAGAEPIRGLVLNLSLTGLLLESPVALGMGEDLDLRFRLPGAGPEVIGCGRVVRVGSGGRYGIEFYGLEGEGGDHVRRFVEALDPL